MRKHALALHAQGAERPASRLFCNPAGDYGSMVNERVGSGEWEDAAELGDTWRSRNAYSFGRGAERGVQRTEVLDELLATTERVVQMVDSVEYGLTDIQEYYANTGALKTAAEGARRRGGRGGGGEGGEGGEGGGGSEGGGGGGAGVRVGVSVVEAWSRGEVAPRELEATLRIEYRTKLLNPRWAEAMAAQGSGGAYEISQRFTAMVGWGATAQFTDDWAFEGAYERYVGDEQMARRLTSSNPEAVRNIARRLLEAHGRGMWETASAEQLERLKSMYQDAEDVVELGARVVS